MNIYIPIEIKARELEGRTLLALVAAERGHEVLLGGKEDTLGLSSRRALAPGIVHDKSLSPGQSGQLLELKRQGHIITAQDEEHGLLDESYGSFAMRRFSEETLEPASLLFCWGEHDKSELKRIYSKHTSKFVATGSPRVDLWRPEFVPYFKVCKNKYLSSSNSSRHYVLISSNFGSILNENPFWVTLERRRRWTNIQKEEEISLFYRAAWQYELLGLFVHAIRRLADTYREISFIVRPHPVESTHAWTVLVGGHENIHVIREGGMSAWIRSAAGLIHNGCTSSFEATAVGTPVIAYRPVQSDFEHTVPNSIGYAATSEKELVDLIGQVRNGNMPQRNPAAVNEAERIMAGRFINLEGALGADRIVDEWERLESPALAEKNNWPQLRRRYMEGARSPISLGPLSSLRAQMMRLIRSAQRKNQEKAQLQQQLQTEAKAPRGKNIHKFPDLPEEEVQDIVNRYQQALGRFQNVYVQRFGRRSFVFSLQKTS